MAHVASGGRYGFAIVVGEHGLNHVAVALGEGTVQCWDFAPDAWDAYWKLQGNFFFSSYGI